MHTKYTAEGFAAVSVSLDNPADQAVMARVRQFLEAKKATFTNLVLDEKPEVWQAKLRFDGPPSVFVFDREGQWRQFTANDLDYTAVEKLVVELLKQKSEGRKQQAAIHPFLPSAFCLLPSAF